MVKQAVIEKLTTILESSNIKVEESMSRHTTFKIGGNADYYVMPTTVDQIIQIMDLCKSEELPFYIIGNGSNLLVGDQGYRGVVIQIGYQMSEYTMDHKKGKTIVTAGAGIMLSKLAMKIAKEGLKGFEFAAGIPGTLGGAIAMNAGAYGGEIKDCILSAKVIDSEGTVKELTNEELQLGYRMSRVQTEHLIVVEATFEFEAGNKEEILEQIVHLNQQRREKQPLEFPSAGSTFKRPVGHYAGKLIMDAGLRGFRIGDVMVSEKHCGFVVNVGNGTAKDVRTLMSEVDAIVFKKYGVHLEPEVRFLGEF